MTDSTFLLARGCRFVWGCDNKHRSAYFFFLPLSSHISFDAVFLSAAFFFKFALFLCVTHNHPQKLSLEGVRPHGSGSSQQTDSRSDSEARGHLIIPSVCDHNTAGAESQGLKQRDPHGSAKCLPVFFFFCCCYCYINRGHYPH